MSRRGRIKPFGTGRLAAEAVIDRLGLHAIANSTILDPRLSPSSANPQIPWPRNPWTSSLFLHPPPKPGPGRMCHAAAHSCISTSETRYPSSTSLAVRPISLATIWTRNSRSQTFSSLASPSDPGSALTHEFRKFVAERADIPIDQTSSWPRNKTSRIPRWL